MSKWNVNNGYITNGKYNIASVNGARTSEGKVNAALIAAAPELLEALQIASSYAGPTDTWISSARKAIAKATK